MNNTLISKNTYARIIVDIDKEYKVKNINDGFTELTGYNEQDINDGLFINRLLPVENYNDYIEFVCKSSLDNCECCMQHKIICKDNNEIAVTCFGVSDIDRNDGNRIMKFFIPIDKNMIKIGMDGKEKYAKDKLTGLYSRSGGEELIKEYLANKPKDEVCALCIIDIDNFYQINDSYGREFGNAILAEVAEKIKYIVRPTDIVVRLGGDEFMVFMKHTNKATGKSIGNSMSKRINSIYAGENKDINISCSIGIVNTIETEVYTQLFNYAFKTLMFVKKNQKGSCLMYHEVSHLIDAKVSDEMLKEKDVDTIMDTNPQGDENIVSFAFSILEKTKDLKSAVNVLLNKIAKRFDLCKIFVFEINEEYLNYTITYKWSEDGNKCDLNKAFLFTLKDYNNLVENFEYNGMFVLNPKITNKFSKNIKKNLEEIMERTNVFCAMYNEGKFSGGIVFESDTPNRQFNQEEINILKELTRVFSTHINKSNSDLASKAKSEFLSRMSHEIRTPMNAIMGMTNIAKSVIESKGTLALEQVEDCLDKINLSTKYLISLVNDILDMSKIENGKMMLNNEPFDLDNLIDEFDMLMKPQFEQRFIKFKIERSYEHKIFIGDSLRITQVLINLVGNALKFTPFSGTVSVRVEEVSQTDDMASINFSVKDNGIGINQVDLKRIFKAFEQVEKNTVRAFGGTGLGLSISSNIVNLMGGKLEVESKERQGSRFFFTLDMKKCSDIHKKYSSDQNNDNLGYNYKGKKALLVEDNDFNSEIAKKFLEDIGFEVYIAYNGKQAVYTYLNNDENHYDIIFMDIRMPVMDGYEATKIIRDSEKSDSLTIPIIALTANVFDNDTKIAIETGMNGYLAKPINKSMMYRVISQILDHEENII